VKTLARYLEIIVDPTFDEFYDDRGSFRRAYLACVAIFHASDRAAEEQGKRPAVVRQAWCKESLEFKIVDVLAHHFKHVQSSDEKIPASRPGIPIGAVLGLRCIGGEYGPAKPLFRDPRCGPVCSSKGGYGSPSVAVRPPASFRRWNSYPYTAGSKH
jgi:hypothetical protein